MVGPIACVNAELPDSLRAFVSEHIHSLVELEALLLLFNHRDRAWSASDIARELRIARSSPQRELDGLCARGIVQCTGGNDPVYRFTPGNSQIEATIAQLATVYPERRVSIIGLIFSKPADKLKTFADAFRIRKDQKDE